MMELVFMMLKNYIQDVTSTVTITAMWRWLYYWQHNQ